MWVPVVLAAVTLLLPRFAPRKFLRSIRQAAGKYRMELATCSVGKSCADLAPAMMKSALGTSPLEKNLRY